MALDVVHRWRQRLLLLRHTWWFRWAHDPLCDRLGHEVLRIGRLRLCQGCLSMYAGAAAGVAAGVATPLAGAARAPAVWWTAAGLLGAASEPSIHARRGRIHRICVRSATGFTGGMLVGFARHRRHRTVALGVPAAATGYWALVHRRRVAKASACDGCPELDAPAPCSGYAAQFEALRAHERAASELAMRRRGIPVRPAP